MLKPVIFYMLGSTLAFIQNNFSYMFKNHQELKYYVVLVLGIPISYLFLFSWDYIMQETNSAWTAKFLFFGLSYIMFPVLAYFFLNESPFTLKTYISVFLSIVIILIQWKL